MNGIWRVVALAAVVVAGGARAQSDELREAVHLHRPGARAQARAELDACLKQRCPDAGRLALLSGVLALSDNDAAAARSVLAAQAPAADLAPFHHFYLAQAHFYAGDPAAAALAFQKALAAAPPSLALRARARLGEALLAAGKPAEALPELEATAAALNLPELYFERAQARAAAGQPEPAREDLRRVAVGFPAHPYADTALAQLGDAVALTLEDRLARAEGLLQAGEPARALAELTAARKAGQVTAPERARVALLTAKAHFAAQEAPEGERALRQAAAGPPEVAAEAALLKARRLLKGDDNAAARRALAALDGRYPRTAAADEAGFLVGWLDLQGGHFARAVSAFETFAKRHPRSRRRDEAAWYRGFALVRLERYADAARELDGLLAAFPKSGLAPQARYWRTRADQLGGGDKDAVGQGYEAVITTWPGSFYALLAAERLRELGRTPPPRFPERPKLLAPQSLPELALAQALARAGLFEDAAEEVRARAAQVRGADQALRFTHALLQQGEFGQAHAIAVRYLWGEAFGRKAPEALAPFYPRAYAPAVEAEASRHGVDPYLVWAIMRRESTFRPDVRSAADAYGLMQLLPKTGSAIAERLSEPAPAPEELYAPGRNVRYGAWYLAQLMHRFGHPALAAAAYNAGPSVAVRWAQEKGALPLDLFVEQIPYKETRGYVKQVVGDLYLYHALYGGEAPPLPMTVPAPTADGVAF